MRLLSRCVVSWRVLTRTHMLPQLQHSRWAIMYTNCRCVSSSAAPLHDISTNTNTCQTPSQPSSTALTSLFHGLPLSERLAALLVARQLSSTGKAMKSLPLHVFASQLHPVTRAAVTASQLTLAEWVKQSALLELVTTADSAMNGKQGEVTRDSAKGESNTQTRTEGQNTSYNTASFSSPSLQVRLRCCDPNTLLTTCEDNTRNERNNAAGSETASVTPKASATTMNNFITFLTLILQRVAGGVGERYVDLDKLARLVQRTANQCECSTNVMQEVQRFVMAQDRKAHLTSYLKEHNAESRFWLVDDTLNEMCFIALRKEEEENDGTAAPLLVPPLSRAPLTHVVPSPSNHFCGWGSANSIPTREDVYEILKYVPVNWGNIGNMNIPSAVRRKHVRCASILMWLRRQPCYFELRDMKGTVEIRRAAWLHPEAHGLTREAARDALLRGLREGQLNTLTPLAPSTSTTSGSNTTVQEEDEAEDVDVAPKGNSTAAETSPTTTATAATTPPVVRDHAEEITMKFFTRVCPSYFTPLSLVLRRAPNTLITEAILLDLALAHPALFEVMHVRYSDVPLVRRRTGVDSARWKDAFLADLTSEPADVRAIMAVCGHLCPLWDRPEYLYVLLSPAEQRIVGGYEKLLPLLRRHPTIFRVGRTFVCRVDSADPLAQRGKEPGPQEALSRSMCRDENPYLDVNELVRVLHYIAPRDTPCSQTLLVQNASPAMRITMPIRLVTVLQLFPQLFACTETTPGVFTVRRLEVKAATTEDTEKTTSAEAKDVVEDDDSWRSDEDGAASLGTRAELIAAIKALVPASGVESAQLLLWASMAVQRAVTKHYGGLANLLAVESAHFRVVEEDGRGKVVYLV